MFLLHAIGLSTKFIRNFKNQTNNQNENIIINFSLLCRLNSEQKPLHIKKSIILILGSELSEVDGRVTQWAEMQPCLFHLLFIHFVFASLASIVISAHDWLATNDTGREVGTTLPATCVIFADHVLAVSAWTLDLLARGFLWWMLCENAYSHIDVFLSFFNRTHSLKLDKSSRTFFVTLKYRSKHTLL